MKKTTLLIALLALALAGSAALYLGRGMKEASGASEAVGAPESPASELLSGAPRTVPISGQVTMVDIGAHSCVPCKMMAPILAEVSGEYQGRAAIVFIDVWQYPGEADKYGIRAIPTQIFYDAEGTERFRHEGFLGKEDITSVLEQLGVPKG